MKRITLITLVTAALFIVTPYGFGNRGNSGHHGKAYHYDHKTVETVRGTITKVEAVNIGSCEMSRPSIHLTITTRGNNLEVHLGPKDFINDRIVFKKGDSIVVEGSRLLFGEKPVIFAKSVKKGEVQVTLRDNEGRPLWKKGSDRHQCPHHGKYKGTES